jgi:hypothetical protein
MIPVTRLLEKQRSILVYLLRISSSLNKKQASAIITMLLSHHSYHCFAAQREQSAQRSSSPEGVGH